MQKCKLKSVLNLKQFPMGAFFRYFHFRYVFSLQEQQNADNPMHVLHASPLPPAADTSSDLECLRSCAQCTRSSLTVAPVPRAPSSFEERAN
jgi:hypothetical protein